MPRIATVIALLFCAAAVLTGCGDDDTGGTSSSTDGTVSVEITFSEGSVTPNGERVEVEVGQPIELVVKADEPGELHVHSHPEQEFEYGDGTTTLTLEPIDQPGVVDVEGHDPKAVVVQFEVS